MSQSASPPLIDAVAREKAANDLSLCYLVEAAAGTGKTTLLIQRILTIVRTTLTPLTRVAAITFTEKAAGELKAKLKVELAQWAARNDDDAPRYHQALSELELMPVSTIHAFCRDLLSQLPVEGGVDPGFAVADEIVSRSLSDEVWEEWLTAELQTECPAAHPLLAAGMPVNSRIHEVSLRTISNLLDNNREDLAALHVLALNDAVLIERLRAFRRTFLAELNILGECLDHSDKLAVELNRIVEWLNGAALDSRTNALHWLSQAPRLSKRGGKAGSWSSSDNFEMAMELRRQFADRVSVQLQLFFSQDAARLVEWLKTAVRKCGELRLAKGLLDYDDLLIYTRNMLRDDVTAREYFKNRYDYILVDEFQDTDPLQAEIVFFLSERTGQSADSWETANVEHGKLFIVGDPKQSIYRFRRADLDLYGRVRNKLAECGEVLSIRMNFRSEPAIISEVNAVFAEAMYGAADDRYEPDYEPMEPYRAAADHEPRVTLMPPPPELDRTLSAAQLAEAEAAAVAEFIRRSAADVPFRDMAILFQTTTHLHFLESALRARNIPYQISGGRNLYRRSEIQALSAVVAAIDNPHDSVSVVGALRSPFFGCSDEELLRHKLHGGHFDYTRTKTTEPHLAECFALLNRLHANRRQCSPSETIIQLFELTAGLQVFALKPLGEQRVANLLKVLDTARGLEANGSYSFHQLVRWLEQLEDLRVGDDEFAAESDADTVRLMTFHKAKGLEFPTVILFQLAHNKNRTQSCFVNRRTRQVEFRAIGNQTSGFDAAVEDDRDRDYHETMRLLYVAMTRARDHLILPLGWTSERTRGETPWLLRLLQPRYSPENPVGHCRIADTSSFDLALSPQENLLIEFEATPDPNVITQARQIRSEWQRNRDYAIAALDRQADFVTPSAHVLLSAMPSGSEQRPPDQSAMKFGSYIHRLLQQVSLPRGENLDDLLKANDDELSVTDAMRHHAGDLIRRALQSELFTQRIARTARYYRELGFTTAQNGIMTEGAMDLVFKDESGWVIVDYKTDAVRAEQTKERAETYRPQAMAYAQALTQITGEPMCDVIFYFLRPGIIVSFPPPTN